MNKKGHKHAALALQYWTEAQQDAEAYKKWQGRLHEKAVWKDLKRPPSFEEWNEYRRKPQVIIINGIEVPEPVLYPLKTGEKYWVVDTNSQVYNEELDWKDSSLDRRFLERGLIHRTEDAAELHAKALLSFTAQP